MDKEHKPKRFSLLSPKDRDLTMFTITNLDLIKKENDNMVYMSLKLKRKIVMELLTTFLPTILLLTITYTTIFFNKDLFGDSLAVNLTIMLVMTTIFTTKIAELPPTSDMKMLDIWLIFCLIVPFAFVIIQTAIENHRDTHPGILDKRPVSAWTVPHEDGQEVLFYLGTIFYEHRIVVLFGNLSGKQRQKKSVLPYLFS